MTSQSKTVRKPQPVLEVAVDVPLRKTFHYLPATDEHCDPGCRVRVPFGTRTLVGIVTGTLSSSWLDKDKLKPISRGIDKTAILTEAHRTLLTWASRYYQHAIGEVYAAALPKMLRKGCALPPASCQGFELLNGTEESGPKPGKVQAQILAQLAQRPTRAQELAKISPSWRQSIKRLLQQGQIGARELFPQLLHTAQEKGPQINADQSHAVNQISSSFGCFSTFLLYGITGSGKTEVYLQLIAAQIAAGKQSLVLVPEIGLTPQLLDRFRRRLNAPVFSYHSGLNETQRLEAWYAASKGEAAVIVGTRSAVFLPLSNPGLIVVDEEHDPSLKQQEGFRYSARDVAVYRASAHSIPIVLGSATPALESIHNVNAGRYKLLRLPERAGNAKPPSFSLVDLRVFVGDNGLSKPLVKRIRQHLSRAEQVMLFINRRGFAPLIYCPDCRWQASCQHCDARMTWHASDGRMRCHHCLHSEPKPSVCGSCGGHGLLPLGEGTQRIEEAVQNQFPGTDIIRIDRDSTSRKGALQEKIARIRSGKPCIIVGTQMLAKGHHFSNVTLVALLNLDHALFCSDFRAAERLTQTLIQVAGRAGRAEKAGHVVLQTAYPDHPVFQNALSQDYYEFSQGLMRERCQTGLPPARFMVAIRADSPVSEAAILWLENITKFSAQRNAGGLEVLGPMPAMMERRAGRFRALLLLLDDNRKRLHGFTAELIRFAEKEPKPRQLRWSVDVDPMDLT